MKESDLDLNSCTHMEFKNMKHIHHALAGSAVAETVVVGTGNPDIDIPAVQAAVDQGGDVVLRGSHWGVSARESVN